MISLLVVALLAQSPGRDEPHVTRVRENRRTRPFSGAGLAAFEAFNSRGMGTFGACSTTAPTGARGEALTFTRASNGTCTKTATGGLATTGIADGDLVVLSSNVARVEYDSAAKLKLLVEGQGINLLPRYNALTDAAWSDVGTPTVTDGATDPFGGATGDTIDDNDGAAYEGRSQPITVAAGAAHIAYCYVKAGTLSAARITLDGTATNITGLSATTWSIVQVVDASSSGVSIVVQVLAGSATSDTGTVIFGGCDAKTGTSISSIVPTVAASATRVAESPYFTVSIPGPTYSVAASFERVVTIDSSSARVATLYQDGSHFTDDYFPAKLTAYLFDGAADSKAHSAAVTTTGRVGSYFDGTNLAPCIAGVCETAAATATWTAWTRVRLGVDGQGGTAGHLNGLVGEVQVDMSPTRAR